MRTKHSLIKFTAYLDVDYLTTENGVEIQSIPHAMGEIGNDQFSLTKEVPILLEKHSEVLEKAIADDDRRVDQSILSDRAAGQLAMRN